METFLAEVRNIKDPDRQGRVQIRIYGLHDDTQNITDTNLPWALPILPVTSASTAKTGTIPTGMEIGSRVVGTFLDSDTKKYPIIFGTYYRAYKPTDASDNTGGQEGNDQSSKGVDLPSSGNPKPPGGADNMGKAPNNPAVGGTPLDTSSEQYNAAKFVDNGTGEDGVNTARNNFAPKASDPTIAGAIAGLDLPSAIKSIDPLGAAQSLAQMFSLLSIITSIMNMTSKSGQSSGVKTTVTDALSGALAILATKYGYETVIDVFTNCLSNNGISQIDQQFRNIVTTALANLIHNASQYGTTNLPLSSTPTVIYHTTTDPVPLPIVGIPPDLYVQQYYAVGSDPWVGFIQWKGPDGNYVYTVRTATDYPFASAQDHIYSLAEQSLAAALDSHIKNKELTPSELNTILENNITETQNNGLEKTLGKNSALNPATILSILGAVGSIIHLMQSLHLPLSALNIGTVSMSLAKFSKNIAIIRLMKSTSLPAFGLPGIGGIPGLSGLAGLAGGVAGNLVGGAIGNLAGAAAGNLAGDVAAAVASGAVTVAAVNNLGGSLNKTAVLTNILLRSI